MSHPRQIFWWIVGGLLAWGVFLALGAYLGGAERRHDLRKPLIVAASFTIFLGFWGAMMLARRSRLLRQARQREESDERGD